MPSTKDHTGLAIGDEIAHKRLFYPCAGNDWLKVLALFADFIDSFTFVDIQYQFDRIHPVQVDGLSLLPHRTQLRGDPYSRLEREGFHGSRGRRNVEPAWLDEIYLHEKSGREIQVTRRRGFGEYALREIPNGSLGVFLHRGDSMGEGGSNAWFLANRWRNHPPLSNLFNTLKRKLAYPALIATDGSNTEFEPLKRATQPFECVPEAFCMERLSWMKVGEIAEDGRRKTIIWRVTPAY